MEKFRRGFTWGCEGHVIFYRSINFLIGLILLNSFLLTANVVSSETEPIQAENPSPTFNQYISRSIELSSWEEAPLAITAVLDLYAGDHSCEVETATPLRYFEGRREPRSGYFLIGEIVKLNNDGSICIEGLPIPLSGAWDSEELVPYIEDGGIFRCSINALLSHEQSIFARCYILNEAGRDLLGQ